ncbi:MAG TPA: GFA family protein [Candidatus Competibacteraceae bacterium]|nr:GFA family protein [Candidatus Competibacteraceae bacterium]
MTNDPTPRATGGCLCGAVRYEIHGPLRPVVACHCSQCRRTSGHYVAATAARLEDFRLVKDEGLRWYQPDAIARRGFCGVCGSNLFWEPTQGEQAGRQLSIMAGTLELSTGLRMVAHICVEDASDYYAVPEDAPHIHGPAHGVTIPDA